MTFDIDDLLSKELITYSELETTKNELQDSIDELHYEIDELEEVLKVIESLMEQCENYGGDLCSEAYLKNLLNYSVDEMLQSIESNMGVYADIVKANLDISGMKDDLISMCTCASIKYDGYNNYFYVI